MIRFDGVSKFFDDKVAVDDISLEVPSGSLFGLIGPNGAGKTTSLKILATLIKPDRGRVTVDGLDLLADVREIRGRIGYMPDAFGVFRGLSCEEYLRFFGRTYGLTGASLTRSLEGVLDLTDLGEVRDELTSALSFGMRQRLSLAKTLLHDPTLLILDEPASGLDPRARIEIRSLLRELGRMGKTIVISSHILADLEEICSDVAIIEQGRIAWSGSLHQALESRESEIVRVHVRLPEADAARGLEAVQTLDCVAKAVLDGNRVHAEVRGARGNEVLGRLIAEGIEVVSYDQERMSLESLFLERTRGLVS